MSEESDLAFILAQVETRLDDIRSCEGFQERECLVCDEAGACAVEMFATLVNVKQAIERRMMMPVMTVKGGDDERESAEDS